MPEKIGIITADPAAMLPAGRVPGMGGIFKRLLANDMDFDRIRDNDVLRDREWELFDSTVDRIARLQNWLVTDLIGRGLAYGFDGMSTTVLRWHRRGDIGDAEMSMSPLVKGVRDKPEWDSGLLPVPITFKDFELDGREIAMGRRAGDPLDTSYASDATYKVMDKIESTFVNGCGTYTFGGGSLQGLTNFTDRNTGSLGRDWDSSSCTGDNILTDVLNMRQASIDDAHEGPWGVIYPSNYSAKVNSRFNAYSQQTILQAILQIEGIQFCRVNYKLAVDQVVLFELQERTVRAAVGLQPKLVEWSEAGGLGMNYKVMGIIVPQMRADYDGKCGIVHFSG